MLNRNVSLVVCLSIIAGAAFAQSSNQGTGYIFEFADTAANSGQFQAFVYNSQSLGTPVFNTAGPSGANQVLPKPDGSKFYVIGSGGVDDFNPSFSTPATINGITGTPNSGQSIVTPDGRYLLVATSLGTGASSVYVLDTTSDTIVLNEPVSGTVLGIVASRDSQTAWILGESSQTFITILNLPAQGAPVQVGSPVFLRNPVSGSNLAGNAQVMALSPLGLLYVGAGNSIVEIVPSTLNAGALNGGIFPNSIIPPTQIQVVATPGPLQFSSDGTMMYFINTTPGTGGKSLLSVSLPGHVVSSWPTSLSQEPEVFDSILVASPTRLFAHSPGDTTLWDVAPDFSTVAPSALNSVIPGAGSILGVALSDEQPSSRYLFTLVGTATQASLDRIDLTTNSVSSQASAALGQGTLQFAIVPPQANPTGFIQYNATQTNLQPGAVAATLIARILDPTGRPMFAVPVAFSGDPSLTFSAVSATTNADGYAQATVTMGQTPGSYPVTLVAGGGSNVATATFALVIPGGSSTGPGNGPNGMSIISGNGQLFRSDFGTTEVPLAIQLLDASGNPLANQNVTFTVVGLQIGILDDPNATTDKNGMASTDFFPQSIAQNTGFQGTTVTAVASQGAVTFNETVWQPDSTNAPVAATVLQPSGTQVFNAGEGDVIPNAIVGAVSLYAFGTSLQIPNVAINITNPNNTGTAGPGTCQGNPLTDVTGTVTCNFIASCSAGLGLHGFTIDFGESIDKTGYGVNIVPGSTQALTVVSGNNQSGGPGHAIPLTVKVGDQCGTATQGVTVTWKVTQGTATLSTTTTVSNQGGNASTSVTLGQAAGNVQIVASINGSTSVTFTESTQTVVGGLHLLSGGGQSALLNQAFPSPLVFQVTDSNNNPIPGLVVTFSLAGGSASLSTTSATTNAQGQVSLTVTAGNAAGGVTVTATYGSLTAAANLTVTQAGPSVTLSSFVNAGSGQAGLTPCGLALVTGAGLAPGVTGVIFGNALGIGPLPYSLNGVSITINGSPAPIQAVSNQNGIQQVNFQSPCELVPGSPATVVVQVGNVSTQVTGVTVYPAQPGIFTYAGPSNVSYGYIVDSNGNILSTTNLAHAGQTYYLITTGLGQTSPAAQTNSVGTNETIPASAVTLDINNIGVLVNSVQYQQGARGEYVISFTIPVPFAAGTNLPVALGLTVNSQTFYDNSQVFLPGIQ